MNIEAVLLLVAGLCLSLVIVAVPLAMLRSLARIARTLDQIEYLLAVNPNRPESACSRLADAQYNADNF